MSRKTQVCQCVGQLLGFSLLILSINLFAEEVTLTDVRFSALPGDVVQMELDFSAVPPEPEGFTIEKPARISLDLPDVSNGLKAKYFSIGTGNARTATVLGVGDKTRVIINMTQLVPYAVNRQENTLFITLGAVNLASSDKRLASSPPSQSDQRLQYDTEGEMSGEERYITGHSGCSGIEPGFSPRCRRGRPGRAVAQRP